MPAGVYDWHVEQGVTSSIDIEYKDNVSNPQPLTDFTAVGQVRLNMADSEPLAALDITITDALLGALTVKMPGEALAGKYLKGGTSYDSKIKAHYDIELVHNTDPDLSVRLLNGYMYISPEVTR